MMSARSPVSTKYMKDDKYIFIDRDGVINKDPQGWTEYGYVTRWEDFHFLPRVFEAFRKLKNADYKAVVVSNQQGVGKGFFTQGALDSLTKKMTEKIKDEGGRIAGVYYCTHLTEEDCSCRKPKTGLFLIAQKELGIKDIKGSFFVGDTQRDMQAARTAGLKSIFVFTGKTSKEDAASWEYKPDYVCRDLLDAVERVCRNV